jgi:hypothetical protein
MIHADRTCGKSAADGSRTYSVPDEERRHGGIMLRAESSIHPIVYSIALELSDVHYRIVGLDQTCALRG